MLDRRLRIGTYLGIDLFVHWTFGLLITYVVVTEWAQGPLSVLYRVSCLFGVFTCVTLHEYGHAMAARMYGVPTVDITLLPIGGVARLKHMPRVPWQELVVAVAGPAVNVVIAALIIGSLAAAAAMGVTLDANLSRFDGNVAINLNDLMLQPSFAGFVLTMLLVNVMLVVFNMIPAFPMDGGRVLRSVLAMLMSYRRATFIASRIGLVCAALMAFAGLQASVFMPIFVAAFIAYAGLTEARQVNVMESVRGLGVKDVLTRNPLSVSMDTSIHDVARFWQSSDAPILPVTSPTGLVVGIVTMKTLAKSIDEGVPPNSPIGQIADHSLEPARLDEELETLILSGSRYHRVLPVVDDVGRLIGTLDLDTLMSRRSIEMLLQNHAPLAPDVSPVQTFSSNPYRSPSESPPTPPGQFDAFS
ncbi:MAG: site-2 protease family protein [Planctomycetota bacterium]